MRIFLTISIFLLSCSNDTKTWKEYYNNGLKKHKNGDYYGAIDDYSKSIELNSNFVYAYWLRGVAKEIMNDRKDALLYASSLIPNDISAKCKAEVPEEHATA